MKSNKLSLFNTFLSLGLSTIILGACGNKSPQPPASEKRVLLSNVSLADSDLSDAETCAQLTQGENSKFLELSSKACPAQGLQAEYQKRLTVYEGDKEKDTTLYLFDEYLLVGEIETKGAEFKLAELCSGDFYSKNCAIEAPNGKYADLKATPEGEIASRQVAGENQVLFALAKQFKANFDSTLSELLTANNRIASQKKALTDLLGNNKADVARLRATVAVQLKGDKGDNGLLSLIEPAKNKIIELRTALEGRVEALKAVDDPLKMAQASSEAANQKLEAKKTERLALLEEIKKAEEAGKKALLDKLTLMTTELGILYADSLDKTTSVAEALAQRSGSDLVKADIADRKSLGEAEEKLDGLLKKARGLQAVIGALEAITPDLDNAIKYASADQFPAALDLLRKIVLRTDTVAKQLAAL